MTATDLDKAVAARVRQAKGENGLVGPVGDRNRFRALWPRAQKLRDETRMSILEIARFFIELGLVEPEDEHRLRNSLQTQLSKSKTESH